MESGNIDKKFFKIETITWILNETPKIYFTKTDLKDAYYTIPIAAEHQKYLKASHRDDLYQLTCLLNRNRHGTRKFTKSLKPPLSTLCLDGVTIGMYLHCIPSEPSILHCGDFFLFSNFLFFSFS